MKKVRILALDGGGIRGIIPATIMEYVEKEIQRKTQNENARIADYFDLIAGTSTGGILSCIYLTPNPDTSAGGPSTMFDASEALEFYVKEGYKIFNASKLGFWKRLGGLKNATKFSPDYIEKLFESKFGNLKMHELKKPCLVTTYDMESKSSYFFVSNEPKEMKREFYVRDVVRSTSAAPTYFPPARIKNLATGKEMVNIDGGVFANNPAMCAYAEARNTEFKDRDINEPSASDMLVLSIGTGGGNFELPELQKSKKWGVLNWAKSIPEIMMDGSVDTVAFQMNEIFGTLDKKEDQMSFKRIKVPQEAKDMYLPDMSDASPANIKNLQRAAALTLEEAKKDGRHHGLDTFIDLLIGEDKVV